MKHQKSFTLNFFLIVIAVISLIIGYPSAGLTKSVYLAADHHTGQFDSWNVGPLGIPLFQWTLGLSYATDPAGIAVHEEWNGEILEWSAVFITSEFSGGVEVVDPRTLTTLGVSDGPSNLAGIDVHDDTYVVYAVRRMTDDLYIFQYDPNAIAINLIDQIDLPNCIQAMGIALDESRDTLWVADTAAGFVRAYDINTWAEDVAKRFATIHKPVDIAVDRVRNLVYTVSIIGGAYVPSGTGSHFLSKYDVGAGVETTTDMGFPGVGVAVDEMWNIVYVTGGANAGDNLSSWDTTTSPFTQLHDTGSIGNPAGIAIGPGIDPGLNLAKNWIIQGSGVNIGEKFTYVITFDSPAVDLTNVVITDILPPEVDFVSATEAYVYDPVTHSVVWNLGSITAGQNVPTLYLDVQVNNKAVPEQTIHNYCQFDCDELPPVSPPEPPNPPEVLPNQLPVAVCQDIEKPLDENGVATITAEDVDGGSTDPDGDPITLSLDKSEFTCADTGNNTVILTVTDDSGASDTCEATVTVVDDTPPDVLCNAPETIVPPDAPISFTATAHDNCGVSSVVINEYDCSFINGAGKLVDKKESCIVEFSGDTITIQDSGGVGDHITWTILATDVNGNTSEVECAVDVVNPGKSK